MLNRKSAAFILRLSALFLSVFLVQQTTHATTVVMPADEDLVVGARAIIRGRVVSISSRMEEQSGRIFSYITIRVQEVLKGQINDREVVLKQEGGQVGNLGSMIFGSPKFETGERVFLYLDTWFDGSLRVHQMFLGKFSIQRDPRTGAQIVIRDTPDNNTVVLDSASIGRPAQRSTNRMELDAYTAMIKSKVHEFRQRSRTFEQNYYQGVALLAQPPEMASVSPGAFQPQFTLLPSGTPARWFEPDDGQPVVYTVNMDGAPGPQTLDDMTAAMNAWSTVAGCSLRLVNGGPNTACLVRNMNTLVFNNCDGRFSPSPGCASVLAIGGLDWDSSQRRVVHGTTFNRANTGHVSFNPYASCDFGDSCKVREIATHEIGHTVGLGHSEFSDATMYAFIHYDGRCASLRQDDINAIVFVYPSATGGALSISTSSPLSPASVGMSYSQALVAGGGTAPFTWSLVAGQGDLPTGLSLSGAGVISGTPTATGTSNFTVQVNDSASASAQKAFALTVATNTAGYDSQFILQSVATTVAPNQVFFVTIRYVNNGSQPWDASAGFKGVSQNPANNTTWGTDSVVPTQTMTGLGQTLDFTFQAVSPHANGIYNFQWQTYKQGVGFFGQKSANVPIVVTDGSLPSVTSPATIDAPLALPFTYQLTEAGGVPPFTWSMVEGSLPQGLTLSSSGMISGTASTAGTVSLTCQVSDAIVRTSSKTIVVNVAPPPPSIVTASLTAGEKNKAYSFTLAAQGGKAPYAFAIVGGALPAGLTMSNTGIISGTPTVDGSFDFTVEITDSDSKTARKALTLVINPPPLTLPTPPSLDVERGSNFSIQLSPGGGRPPYSFTVASGSLPPGVSLNASSGIISGMPTENGTFSATVAVHDQPNTQVSVAVQIRVLDPGTIPVIKKAKYKSETGKLTVKAKNLGAGAGLLIDGVAVTATAVDGVFTIKHLGLGAGQHQIRVVNPGSVLSMPVIITVN